jgi:signal transduction histidine kinase
MSGIVWLDWAAMAISLHNTILLLWLGSTILLNADRRTWAIWLTGASLLLAGAFFVSHSVILAFGVSTISQSLDFWWHLGWIPTVSLPLTWYIVALWYAGFWEDRQSALYRRKRPGLLLTYGLTLVSAALLVLGNPVPSLVDRAAVYSPGTPEVAGVPVLFLVYVLDILLCMGLSLDALRLPGPSARVMGTLARDRARPWLMAATIALLTVALLVAGFLLWTAARYPDSLSPDPAMVLGMTWFDLCAELLIAAATLLLGQAIALYEVFTGKTLPRREFMRQWRNAVILAAGYGIVVGGSLIGKATPIYSVLLTTMVMVAFYGLFSWRSFVERDRYIRHLRPFLANQHLYDQLVAGATAALPIDVATPFRALCRDVLGARSAQLTAVGPLAPLVPVVTYPEGGSAPNHLLDGIMFDSPQTMCVPLDPSRRGAMWAVPLWSERGLSGILSLGAKSDGGLYTQEEIEIARATGERLIDTCASAELARRLMELQRQRLTETQLLDQQARRLLHDDVLPRLHAAMLILDGAHADGKAIDLLVEAHRRTSDLLHDVRRQDGAAVAQLGFVPALQDAVERDWGEHFDTVAWSIEAEFERRAQAIPLAAAETLFYAAREAVRNAAQHGRGECQDRPLHMRIEGRWKDGIVLIVEDDGIGFKRKPRGSEGGGQGLALHSAMLAIVGGTLVVEPNPMGGTRVILTLPVSASTS